MLWLVRTQGLRKTVPTLAITTAIVTLGLVLPFEIPGYGQAVLGFNLSNGNGTTFHNIISIADGILPQAFQLSASQLFYNQVWIGTTAALYTVILGIVWLRARSLGPIDVALLGLLVWLIPLRIEYTHYAVWALVPFIMRGRLRQTLIVLGLLQLADAMAIWTWWPSINPIPGIDAFYGLVLTSTIYRLAGATALGFVLNTLRKNPSGVVQN